MVNISALKDARIGVLYLAPLESLHSEIFQNPSWEVAVTQNLNLEAEALRRQMDSARDRARRLPVWLTRSASLAASNSENDGTSHKGDQPAIKGQD
jgi:hypothetical protein